MALKYEDIKKEFQDAVNNDKVASKLYAQIRNGDASYATSGQLAQRIGADLGQVLMKHAPTQSIDEWDVDDLIPKALGLDHRMVTTACKQVQENMNKNAGIGIKYKEPKFNRDKAYGIAKELHNNPDFTNIQKTFCDQLENFSRSVVDDSIVANADVMWNAGIKTLVVRIAEGGCCKWCSEMAGVYDYAEVREPGNDVWRRHENCNCTIDFYTEKNGKVYRERVKEGNTSNSDSLTGAFHTYDDPIREVMGSAYESHPIEIVELKKRISELGVELVESTGSRMGYISNPMRGNPGQIIIDTEASYSAWLHEYQHALDDQASGWQGAKIVWIKEQAAEWEARAYDVEIEFARTRGYNEIVERLQRLKKEAISRILNG